MIPINAPKPIEDFSKANLCGWKKNRIVVSNHPDPRLLDFDFESTVFCNWPSQQHRRYPEGFIQFNNGRKFDRRRRTIRGVQKFLFFYRDVKPYWDLHLAQNSLRQSIDALPDNEFFAAAELLVERAEPTVVVSLARSRALAEDLLSRYLPSVGLFTLRELRLALAARGTEQGIPHSIRVV